jgi:hypothetical protein
MRYAFSLEVLFEAHGTHLTLAKAQQPKAGIRHLFDETVVTMPEKLRCDIPTAEVISGDGDVGDPQDPLSPSLRIRLGTKVAGGKRLGNYPDVIDLNGDGVVLFQGGPLAFRSAASNPVSGSAFLAASFETASATYRWLERRQLFGPGRLTTLDKPPGDSRPIRLLHFTFDLYGGA